MQEELEILQNCSFKEMILCYDVPNSMNEEKINPLRNDLSKLFIICMVSFI